MREAPRAVPHSTERFVARRFDAVRDRFKTDVAREDVRLEAVARVAGPLGGRLILDLGCGKGRFARRWTEAGATVVGLDAAPGMLEQAAGFFRVRGSAGSLPFAAGCFDLVIAIDVLEHVEDRLLPCVLAEARRVLVPGGAFLIIDKNARALDAHRPWLPAAVVKRIDEHRGRWMYRPGEPFRERWFSPPALDRMLSSRFVDVRHEYLLRPEEAGSRVFRRFPATRLWTLWHARVPEANA